MNLRKTLIVAVAWCLVAAGCYHRTEDVRLAAGTPGSGIHDLGMTWANLFNAEVPRVRVQVVESAERRNSLERVLQGEAAYALVMRRRMKRKGTMDGLFKDFQQWAHQSDEATPTAQLHETWQALKDLRRRAFDELVAGKVEANCGFVVFHDYLRAEVQEVERILRTRSDSSMPPGPALPDADGSSL